MHWDNYEIATTMSELGKPTQDYLVGSISNRYLLLLKLHISVSFTGLCGNKFIMAGENK
jgi:hypothetical protein